MPPLHIYCWTLGFGLSPHDVASRFGHRDVHDLLVARSPRTAPIHQRRSRRGRARGQALFSPRHPSLLPSLTRKVHGHLAHAIFHERFDAADLMLRLGFDPAAPGIDGGTALHAACWVGSVRMVDRLLARGGVPLDAQGSDPPEHAARMGRVRLGASPRARRRLPRRRGAARGRRRRHHRGRQRGGANLLAMAQGNAEMQEALRRLGAT